MERHRDCLQRRRRILGENHEAVVQLAFDMRQLERESMK